MNLVVQDLMGSQIIDNESGLKSALRVRYADGVNSFKLIRGNHPYPGLLILVRGELATLHFFPADQHPGMQSIGDVPGLDRNGSTTFYMNSLTHEEPVFNEAVVSFDEALQCAQEFLVSGDLPHCIKWFEL